MAQAPHITQESGAPAQLGDTTTIDFKGTIDGVAFAGGAGKNHDLVLGSHSFIPGFEEQLVGVKAGETRDVKVTFPKDYGSAAVAGKDAVFAVQVNKIQTRIVPDAAQIKKDSEALERFRTSERTVMGLEDRMAQLDQEERMAQRGVQNAKSAASWVSVAGMVGAVTATIALMKNKSFLPKAAMAVVVGNLSAIVGWKLMQSNVERAEAKLGEVSARSVAYNDVVRGELGQVEDQLFGKGKDEAKFADKVPKGSTQRTTAKANVSYSASVHDVAEPYKGR